MVSGFRKILYKPGEVVPKAGIYRVLHKEHRGPHEASLQSKQIFPRCKQCGGRVRFELLLAVEDEKCSGHVPGMV